MRADVYTIEDEMAYQESLKKRNAVDSTKGRKTWEAAIYWERNSPDSPSVKHIAYLTSQITYLNSILNE